MSPRPPSDAVVALRSLPRRFRSLFTGLGDDESPDALAVRPGTDGTTVLGHLAAAVGALRAGGQGVERILTADDPTVDPLPTAGAGATGGSLEQHEAELAAEAEALASRGEHVSADGWARRGQVAGGGDTTAADLLWQAVDASVDHLRAAERTLAEARQAR